VDALGLIARLLDMIIPGERIVSVQRDRSSGRVTALTRVPLALFFPCIIRSAKAATYTAVLCPKRSVFRLLAETRTSLQAASGVSLAWVNPALLHELGETVGDEGHHAALLKSKVEQSMLSRFFA
jgi:hypothetical protein